VEILRYAERQQHPAYRPAYLRFFINIATKLLVAEASIHRFLRDDPSRDHGNASAISFGRSATPKRCLD
jgi:hypothetical protein